MSRIKDPADDDSEASIGNRRGRKAQDPLTNATRTNRDETARWLSLVSRGVKYSDFLDADPPLGVNVFEELRTVALIDTFFQLDDAAILAKIDMQPDVLKGYRENPQYQPMVDALKGSAKRLGGADTVDGVAEAMEKEVVHEVYAMGMLEGNAREKLKALTEFVDRRSAKKGREGDAGSALMIPERMLELMALGLEKERHLLPPEPRKIGEGSVIDIAAEADDSISADRLNVPTQEED